MTYTPQTWANGVIGGTPIDAARLQYMENGIAAAHNLAIHGNIRYVENFNLDVNDSGPAFLAAIADLPASGGIVYALGSSYNFTEEVFWDDKCVHCIGAGSGFMDGPVTGTKITVAAGKSAFHVMNGAGSLAARSRISGFHLIGSDSAPATNPGIYLQSSMSVVEDVVSQGFGGDGLEILSVSISGAVTSPTATPVSGGGTFTAGTYYFRIAPVTAAGEGVASAEVSATVLTNGSVNLTWAAFPSATNYRIYRSTTSNGTKRINSLVKTVGAVTSTTDTGTTTTHGNAAHTQGSVNTNLSVISQTRLYNNHRDGLRIAGSDSNVIKIYGLDANANTGWGVYDSGILGNAYYSPHFSSNATGGFRVGANGAKHRIYAGYVEDDDLPAVQFDLGSYGCDFDFAQLSADSGGHSRIIDNSVGTNNRVTSYSGGGFKTTVIKVGPPDSTESVQLDQDGIYALRGKSFYTKSPNGVKTWSWSGADDGSSTLQSAAGGTLIIPNPVSAPSLITSSTPRVLKFSSSPTANHIHHGKFWPTGTDLGRFWWEAWIRVASASAYWVSEGYGGAHALLIGWGGTLNPTGNMSADGASTAITMGGDYVAANGEWLNDCMSWDGTTIRRYINGIIVYSGAYSGARRAQQGYLYIGGSHHQNFYDGTIGAVRGFEGTDFATDTDPLPQNSNYLGANFFPMCPMPRDELILSPERIKRAAFYAQYHGPGLEVNDLGAGYGGFTHPGNLRGTATSYPSDDTVTASGNFPPLAEYVVDETSPFVMLTRPIPTQVTQTAPTTPASAVIFDSFSRNNQTLAFQAVPTLGSTEAGSGGTKSWTQGSKVAGTVSGSWGILQGRARYLLPNNPGLAYVSVGSATQDVRVDRTTSGTAGMHHTGLTFRVADNSNFWSLHTTGSTLTTAVVALSKCVSGTITQVTTWSAPATSWTTLRATASGTTLTAYVDNGSGGWTSLGSVTDTDNQTNTGAGLYASGVELGAKTFNNFTVL